MDDTVVPSWQLAPPEILEEFHEHLRDTEELTRWLAHEYPEVRRNRVQVTQLYPVVANLVTRAPDIPAHMEIAAVIDRGEPFVSRVASILGVGKAAIRSLKGKGLRRVGPAWFDNPAELIEFMSHVPHPLHPCSVEDWLLARRLWVAFADLRQRTRWLSESHFRKLDTLAGHMMRGCSGKRLHAAARQLLRPGEGVLPCLVGLRDYLEFVSDWCAAGAGISKGVKYCPEIVGRSIADDFLMRYSAMQIVQQSERWHRSIAQGTATEALDPSESSTEEWPPLPGLPMHVGNLIALPLTNRLQLRLEGGLMDHCVSNYYWPCMEGLSHIISVRDANGDTLSTAEVVLDFDIEGSKRLWLEQHRGARNDQPPPASLPVIEKVMAWLRSDGAQRDLVALSEYHALRREAMASLRCEQDPAYFAEAGSRIMQSVLPDPDGARNWLDRRLALEEGIWALRNEKAGERMARNGLDAENTWDYAFELYRDHGDVRILDEDALWTA